MAIVSFSTATVSFNIEESYVPPNGPVNTTEGIWAWFTAFGGIAGLEGTGLTYSGDAVIGGTFTGAGINLSGNSPIPDADMYIASLSIDAVLLTPLIDGGLTGSQQDNLFWRTVLSGDDQVEVSSPILGGFITFGGDGADAEAGQVLFGGADVITLTGQGRLSGDFFDIAPGAVVYGGNDAIYKIGESSFISGDADDVSGYLVGGDDYIVSSTSNFLYPSVFGDADTIETNGIVVGGNDTLIGAGPFSRLSGDVDSVSVGGSLFGGDDILIGGATPGSMVGDAHSIEASATNFFGGNDVLIGEESSDILYGDWRTNNLGSAAVGGKVIPPEISGVFE